MCFCLQVMETVATDDDETAHHECSVCFSELDEGSARILPCTHTFCDTCLTHIATDQGMATRCPLCRRAFTKVQSNGYHLFYFFLFKFIPAPPITDCSRARGQ